MTWYYWRETFLAFRTLTHIPSVYWCSFWKKKWIVNGFKLAVIFVLAFQSDPHHFAPFLSSLCSSCCCRFFSVQRCLMKGQLRKHMCHQQCSGVFLCFSGLFLEFISVMGLGPWWQDVNGFLTGQTAVLRGVKFSVKSSILWVQIYLRC